MLRGRHEPSADRRRDARDVSEGSVARYVDVPPAPRGARAPPAGSAHCPPEPPRETTRKPSPSLLTPADAPNVANIRLSALPLAAAIRASAITDDAANQTELRPRFYTGSDCRQTSIHSTADVYGAYVASDVFLRHVQSYFLVRQHEPYVVDLREQLLATNGGAHGSAGGIRGGSVRRHAGVDGLYGQPFPTVHVPYLSVLPRGLKELL